MIYLQILLLLIFSEKEFSCKDDVAEAYRRLKASYQGESRNLSMKYSITIEYSSGKMESESISMNIAGSKSMVSSRLIRLVQDQETLVGIDEGKRTILISRPTVTPWKQGQLESMNVAFDSLFHKLKLVSCESGCSLGGNSTLLKKIQFSFEAGESNADPLLLTYYLTEKEGDIRIIEMKYPDTSEIRQTRFSLDAWSTKQQSITFSGSAISQIMDSKGVILPRYKAYQIVDTRK